MNYMPVKIYRLMGLVWTKPHCRSPKNEVVCLKNNEFDSFSVKKGRLALDVLTHKIPTVCEITPFNVFDAIISEIQKTCFIKNGYCINTENGCYFGETDPDSIFNALGNKRVYLWKGKERMADLSSISKKLAKEKIYAVLYNISTCDVRCYEFNDGAGKEVFCGSAEDFNKEAAPYIDAFLQEYSKNEELKKAFFRLWDEKKKQLAASRFDKDGVPMMKSDLDVARWQAQIEKESKPKDSDLYPALTKYKKELKHE